MTISGIRRSGNHAIATWLIYHFENIRFFNNYKAKRQRMSDAKERNPEGLVRPQAQKRPNRPNRPQNLSNRNKRIKTGAKRQRDVFRNNGHRYEGYIKSDGKLLSLGNKNSDHSQNLEYEFTNEIYGLENYYPHEIEPVSSELSPDHKIMIIRDPINNLASLMKYRSKLLDISQFKDIWCSYAAEALDQNSEYVIIMYDRWFTSSEYRREIESTLGLEHNDDGINKVHSTGNGSSFDNMSMQNDAQNMNVLERWKEFKDDEDFLEIINNEEMLDLRKKTFGDLPSELDNTLNQSK